MKEELIDNEWYHNEDYTPIRNPGMERLENAILLFAGISALFILWRLTKINWLVIADVYYNIESMFWSLGTIIITILTVVQWRKLTKKQDEQSQQKALLFSPPLTILFVLFALLLVRDSYHLLQSFYYIIRYFTDVFPTISSFFEIIFWQLFAIAAIALEGYFLYIVRKIKKDRV